MQAHQPDSERPPDTSGAEERLSEERQIFFSGPVVVFKWRNAEGWPVEYVSHNVGEVLGYAARDFLEGHVAYAEIVHPEDLQRVTREVQVASESDVSSFTHKPYRIKKETGDVVWLDDYTTILRAPDGSIEHYIGYVIDITERKLIEQESEKLRAQLLHVQKLESLGVMAGGIAHDFNNLLTGILGNLSLAREAGSRQIAEQHFDLMHKSASRAADLCKQLLAYSGKGQFVVGSYDLNSLVSEMADLLAVSISRQIELRYELSDGLPPIRADATQIRQLLMNLITNASEAIGENAGVIVLETGSKDGLVFARVSDNGSGMDEETRKRIFDPFFTTKFEGRGLGLAAVLGILRSHGGSIAVESELEKGTRVEVRLHPSTDPVDHEPSPPPFDPAWRSRGTVLVIDDEEMIRIMASHVLPNAGFEVETAHDGAEGIELFRKLRNEVVLVFLDLTMPGMSGVDVYDELLKVRPEIPVLLSSGFERREALGRFSKGRLPFFLPKPFEPRDLLVAVRQVIESRTSVSS